MNQVGRRIYDVTLPLGPSMPTWPDDPSVSMTPALTIEQDGARVSRLSLGTHSGTHVDAAAHLVAGGQDAGALDLHALIGPALVVYLPEVKAVTVAELVPAVHTAGGGPERLSRVLLKTGNSDRGILAGSFTPHYVALASDAAQWLVDQGTILVGIDALSVDTFDDALCTVHRILLARGIVIVEGLDLRQVAPGMYDLLCLPLRIPGSDGAPARAVLVEKLPG
jgi:arylformamidase